MKRTLLILLLAVQPMLMAQENLATATESDKPAAPEPPQIPEWVREISNLPPDQRTLYTESFNKAKKAYAQGSMAECESHLNTCEMYTGKNPSVWNLRASVCISQRRFDEAKLLLEKVRRDNPQDAVASLSFSLLYLGSGEYQKCLDETSVLIGDLCYSDMDQLVHSLKFRRLLCYIRMGREDDAQAEVATIGPMEDSPLYYYSQAVFSLLAGDRRAALRYINTADSIYGSVGYIPAYKQALEFSGVLTNNTP